MSIRSKTILEPEEAQEIIDERQETPRAAWNTVRDLYGHPEKLHEFFWKLGISDAAFSIEVDGTGLVLDYQYIGISDIEFQLFRLGDMPTNYVLNNPV